MKIDQNSRINPATAKSDFAAMKASNPEPFATILASKVCGAAQASVQTSRLTGEHANIAFNSVLDDLLSQPELTTLQKLHLVGEAAMRNLSSVTEPLSAAVDDINSIIYKLSQDDPHILSATKAWREKMQPVRDA